MEEEEGKEEREGERREETKSMRQLQVMPLWESFAEMFPQMVRRWWGRGGDADGKSRRSRIKTARRTSIATSTLVSRYTSICSSRRFPPFLFLSLLS